MNELDKQLQDKIIQLIEDVSMCWETPKSVYTRIRLPLKNLEISIVESSIFIEVGEYKLQGCLQDYIALADAVHTKDKELRKQWSAYIKQAILNEISR